MATEIYREDFESRRGAIVQEEAKRNWNKAHKVDAILSNPLICMSIRICSHQTSSGTHKYQPSLKVLENDPVPI